MKHIDSALRRRGRATSATVASLVAMTLFAACPAPDSGTGPEARDAGVYALTTVDEDQLPAVIHQGPWFDPINKRFYNRLVVQILGGRVQLHNDDSFSIDVEISYVGDGVPGSATSHIAGFYMVHNGEIVFAPKDTAVQPLLGDIERGSITLPIDFMSTGRSNLYAFRRER